MKKILAAVAITLVSGWTVAQAEAALKTHPDSKAWPDLFATNMSNAIYPAGVWVWQDGILSSTKKDQAIWTQDEYENFILDFEFYLEPGANSGVFVYNTDMKNWVPNTVEIQLLDDASPKWTNAAPNWKCGGVFGHSVPLKSVVKPAGEWNRMTIRCHGKAITVLLNGEVVTDLNMQDWKSGKTNPDGSKIPSWLPRPLSEMATKGRIGLQGAHGGIPSHFRNLKIKAIE
jgi:hypothetical protein